MQVDLVIRNVQDIDGNPVSVAVREGQIAAWGADVPWTGPELDGGGCLLVPGFHDHHLHLMATAARMASVDLAGLLREEAIITTLRSVAAGLEAGLWLRVVGYDERVAGLPDADQLTHWLPDHPMRMQDRTGALWILNRPALDRLGPGPYPPGVELDSHGYPTGRIWRADSWLRQRLGTQPPDLRPLADAMVRAGITGVTDAGAENGAGEAALLSSARLPQRLMLMGQEHLPAGNGYSVGPLKIAYDERDLPPVAHVADRIRTARKQQRTVAAHCVTLAELAVYLAALDLAGGAMPGDRIEHGGIIPGTLVPEIAERRLTIVTQPAFIHDRGDRYRDQIDPDEWPDLYRLCSLMVAGVAVAAGSDAPYGSLEPMVAVRAAMTRRTQAGAVIATAERLDWRRALGLYLGAPGDPGQPRWHLRPGDAADLCLVSPGEMAVTGTVIGGRLLYHRG